MADTPRSGSRQRSRKARRQGTPPSAGKATVYPARTDSPPAGQPAAPPAEAATPPAQAARPVAAEPTPPTAKATSTPAAEPAAPHAEAARPPAQPADETPASPPGAETETRPSGTASGTAKAPSPYPGEKARQGEIILRTRTRRWIFFGGLIAFVVLVLLASFLF